MSAQTVEDLEKEYKEAKAAYEKWKIENSRQEGTVEYDEYMRNFATYEATVIESINRIRNPRVEGPKSVDAILEELLSGITYKDFVTALMKMSEHDPTFIKTMITNLKNLQSSNLGLIVPQAVNPANFHVGSASSLYGIAPAQIMPVAPMTNWNQQPNWQQHHLRGFKPPSPHRDYKNPTSTMPFKDFSQ